MRRNKERSLDDIMISNLARLSGEAPKAVGKSYNFLYKKWKAGRLRVQNGVVKVDHLQQQELNGYPELDSEEEVAH